MHWRCCGSTSSARWWCTRCNVRSSEELRTAGAPDIPGRRCRPGPRYGMGRLCTGDAVVQHPRRAGGVRAATCAARKSCGPLERLIYRGAGVDPGRDMGWVDYALAMLWFNILGALVVYALQRAQLGRAADRWSA